MKAIQYVALFTVLNALALFSTIDSVHAAQAKGHTSQRGGNADSHMSPNGRENTNAQWSADPERGWVRSDERHDLHRPGQSSVKDKKPRGKKTNERKSPSY